jgi:3-methyladenine DNA glycosylase AlkD
MAASKTIADITRDIASRVVAWPDYTVPGLRRLRREVSRELRQDDPRKVVRVALRLAGHRGVPRWFAYELVSHHPAAPASLTRDDVERLGRGINTWGDVDAFGCYIAGPAFREGHIRPVDVRRWARSGDRWWRRAALVSTVPLNNSARGGHGDSARTLAVCDHLRGDRDDMVVKALSWALRELAKKDPGQVDAYLFKHGAELAPRVLREVRNKLRTGLKNPKPTAAPPAS